MRNQAFDKGNEYNMSIKITLIVSETSIEISP